MIRKVSIVFISVAIVVTGVIAFKNLHYWERSVVVFKVNSEQPFGRGIDRNLGGFEGRERHGRTDGYREGVERQNRQDLPDSTRQRIISERELLMMRDSTIPDTTRQQFGNKGFRGERGSFRGENNYRDRRHGGYREGNEINLGTVGWFLAVFALFTLITIVFDKALKFVKQRKYNK